MNNLSPHTLDTIGKETREQIEAGAVLLEQAADAMTLMIGGPSSSTENLRAHAKVLRAIVARHTPCPTCPSIDTWTSWIGPCPEDGKNHALSCPIGQAAHKKMTERHLRLVR